VLRVRKITQLLDESKMGRGALLRSVVALTVPNFVVFFRLLNRKFNEDSKNVLKTVIFSLHVRFTNDFVFDCYFKLAFWQFKL